MVLVFQHYWLRDPSDCAPLAHRGRRGRERLEVEKLVGPMGSSASKGQCEPVVKHQSANLQPAHFGFWLSPSLNGVQQLAEVHREGQLGAPLVCTKICGALITCSGLLRLGLLIRALIQKAGELGSVWGGLGPWILSAGKWEMMAGSLEGVPQQPSCQIWEEEVLGFGLFSSPFFQIFNPVQVYEKNM